MNCYDCAKAGLATPAVAMCTHCNCGVCLEHLRSVRFDAVRGAMGYRCEHDTWRHIDGEIRALRR